MRKNLLHNENGFTRLASEINDWTAIHAAEIVPIPNDISKPEAHSIRMRFDEDLPRRWREFTTNLESQTTSTLDALQQRRLGGQILSICAKSRATMTALIISRTRNADVAKRVITEDLYKTAKSLKAPKTYREYRPEEFSLGFHDALRRSRNLTPEDELTPQEMLRGSLYLGTLAMSTIIDGGKAEGVDIAAIPVPFTSF